MTALVTRTIQKTKPLSILQSDANRYHAAVVDCVDTYGNFIWALAKKFTNSTEEAEEAAQEIFIDIWRYAERNDKIQSAENFLDALIARRRLIKHLQ